MENFEAKDAWLVVDGKKVMNLNISDGLYYGFNDGKVVTENERNSRISSDTADSSGTKTKRRRNRRAIKRARKFKTPQTSPKA